ncbi:YhdP family protein [Pseudoduganella sp. GCM10020061]|uniref:YhdP family protein n=1 Tax=Pseudoduganella sp. GCM10020061 TaxID=3317345 RepID=UPI0036397DEA
MHNPNTEHATGEHLPLAERWARMRTAYRMANRASHHVLGFAIKAVLLAYFLFGVIFLVLRYVVLPNVDYYKTDIERIASRAIGNPVTIQRVYASWNGLRPHLFLGDVVIRDRQGRPALTLPTVTATVSWWSVPAADLRFETLEIIRPDLDVRRTRDGALYVAGMRIQSGGPEGKGGEWALKQRAIIVRDGRVRWTDELRGAAPLELTKVELALRNRWNRHQFALRATPPAALSQPLDVRAHFRHPRFARRSTDVSLWKGELYADLRNTDLAAWKQYVDYPFTLNRGRGSVRAWLAVDHARMEAFTADVALADVNAQLARHLPPLDLARVTGRISASEQFDRKREPDGKPTFGAHGHTVSLDKLAVQLAGAAALPPMSMSETFTPATATRPARTRVTARMLDLGTLAHLAGQLPLTQLQRQLLANYAPRGRLSDFSAQWEGRYPAIQSYRIKGKVEGLSVRPQPAREARPASAGMPAVAAAAAIPGVDNLTGSVDASDKGGEVRLASRQVVLQLPGYFAEPAMPFDRLDADLRWAFEDGNRLRLDIGSLHFAQGQLSGSLRGRHTLPLKPGAGAAVADLHGTLTGFDIGTVGRFLPLSTPPHLHTWLTTALEGGMLNDAAIRLRGDLSHFPFHGDRPAERAQGEFRVAARIADGRLNYDPSHTGPDGKSPLWPVAERINGTIVFDRARMEIHAQTASTRGVALSDIKAVVPDLSAADKLLEIDGKAAAPLQGFVDYMAASPVLGWIGHFTERTRATGNARLGIKLQIPLSHPRDTKVRGALQLQGNEIALFPELPAVQNATGRIEFFERGVTLPNIAGSFLGGPLTVSGGSQREGGIVVRLAGSATADGIKRAWPAPEMQRLATRFSGATRFAGLVTVRDGQVQVAVDSSLAGLGLHFPAPLSKAAAEPLPLRFVLNSLPPAGEVGRDELRVSLGQLVQARYQREKTANGAWRVVRGGIGVNNPAPEPDSGLLLNVSLKSLDVDQWTALGREIAGGGGAAVQRASAGPGLAQYVVPDVTAARATELVIGGRKLDEVVVGATHTKGTWQASIDSRQIGGYLTWDDAGGGQNLGKVTARLSSLVIPESAQDEVKNLLEGDNDRSATIPALDVVAERFVLFGKEFGKIELVANNSQVAVGKEWKISKLAISNPDGDLDATGRWVSKDGNSITALDFQLGVHDAGKLLDRLGFPDTLKRGKGKLSGEVSWHGLPYKLDTPTLSGSIHLDLGAGQFLKQDPGAAKLLGVLSLQMLPRMLKLDFRDVFSEGLAFDGITASAVINRGVLKTDNLRMHGVAATVLMDGTADIARETADLHVVVIPEFNLGTGPLVYALAVNPVVGIGGFLAQLFLRAPVMRALTYEMKVSGPWKEPVITKIANPNRQAAAAAKQ